MTWELNADRPVYIQIVEQLELNIITGIYKTGEKMPSVRELAAEASVNPNTMQKALTELERGGLIYTQRTNGRFITEDRGMIMEIKKELVKEQVTEFLNKMDKLGFSRKEIRSLILELGEDEGHE